MKKSKSSGSILTAKVSNSRGIEGKRVGKNGSTIHPSSAKAKSGSILYDNVPKNAIQHSEADRLKSMK